MTKPAAIGELARCFQGPKERGTIIPKPGMHMVVKALTGLVVFLFFSSAVRAGVISGRSVQTLIQTETQTIVIDQDPILLAAPLTVTCRSVCALKITLTAAVDVTEPETSIYGEALVNGVGEGIVPYDLVPLVQNLPFGTFRMPFTWTWVATPKPSKLPQQIEVALYTNGKLIQVYSRSIVVEVLSVTENK
jgi:hypothetical protein